MRGDLIAGLPSAFARDVSVHPTGRFFPGNGRKPPQDPRGDPLPSGRVVFEVPRYALNGVGFGESNPKREKYHPFTRK